MDITQENYLPALCGFSDRRYADKNLIQDSEAEDLGVFVLLLMRKIYGIIVIRFIGPGATGEFAVR